MLLHLCTCGIVCMCECQTICNPEDHHKCRRERELPSVRLLLTSSVALTIFLMHNYPDAHSRRVFFSNEVASVTRLELDSEADYKIGLTHIAASGNSPRSRNGFCCGMNQKGPFWVNWHLIICMTSFSCLEQFSFLLISIHRINQF